VVCPADELTVDCIDHIEQSKKSGRPITISLRPNFDLLAQLKALHVLFLDDNGMSTSRPTALFIVQQLILLPDREFPDFHAAAPVLADRW
jgi:hypothetical protein